MDDRRNRKPVTIVDVARAAGVSAMTVSNVFNDRGRVSAGTVTKVLEVVADLGYRPSVAARRLRLSKQWTVGMLLVVEDQDFLSDPFTTALVTGLTNYLTEMGYSLIIRGIKPSNFRTASLFQGIEADGIVAVLSGSERQRKWFVDQLGLFGIPIVLLQEQFALEKRNVLVIRQDDFQGGRYVGAHLLASGIRRLWMLVPDTEWPAMRAREEGVRAELAAYEDADLLVLRCGDESYRITFERTSAALRQMPAPGAIIGGNDQIAIAAMQACRGHGLAVPADVHITGFNGFEFCRYVDPVLTTVLSPARELGQRAGMELIACLGADGFAQSELVLPVSFQPGDSSGGPLPEPVPGSA